MKKFLFILGAFFVVFLVAVKIIIPVLVKKALVKTVSFTPAKGQATADASGWEKFHSSQFGYSVSHPKDWIVSDADFPKKQEIWVKEINNDAYVKINAYFDKNQNSSETVKNAINAFREKMNSEPDLKVAEFQDSSEGEIGGFIAKGEQVIGQEKFLFESRGLLSTNGRILIFHGAVKASESPKYGDTIPKIITSFSLDKN